MTVLVERIKREANILREFRDRGFVLSKRGKDYVTLCFLHDEDTPSLIITPDNNLWHCFGCDAGGSVIDFVMKYDKVSFHHALTKLSGNGDLSAFKLPGNNESTNGFSQQKLLKRVVDFYHKTFLRESAGQDYLHSRGITSSEAVTHFKIGHANRTLGLCRPT